jgi:hypothetical protein
LGARWTPDGTLRLIDPGCNGLRSKPAPRERWLEGLTWFQLTSCYYFHPIGLKGPVAFLLLDYENLDTDEFRV